MISDRKEFLSAKLKKILILSRKASLILSNWQYMTQNKIIIMRRERRCITQNGIWLKTLIIYLSCSPIFIFNLKNQWKMAKDWDNLRLFWKKRIKYDHHVEFCYMICLWLHSFIVQSEFLYSYYYQNSKLFAILITNYCTSLAQFASR